MMTKVAVAVLHGFNSTPLFMKGIEYELRNWGKCDQILNLSLYGSKWGIWPNHYNLSTPIIRLQDQEPELTGTITEHVLTQMKEKVEKDVDEIILLGHSMGGLVWRTLYKVQIADNPDNWLDRPSPKVKSIIQLASPNQGSRLTNMRFIEIFDKIQSTIILKLAGYTINLIKKVGSKIGLTDGKEESYEVIENSTQIKQMKPGSSYLEWLNSDPTYVDKIPHYRMIGQRNGVFFTNLAWVDSPDELDPNEIVDELKGLEGVDNPSAILDKVHFSKDITDDELREIIEKLNEEEEIESDTSIIDYITDMFDEDSYIPNDGLVSIEDAKLPGSIQIDLAEHAGKISHWSICMWFLPFKPYRFVRDQVFNVIEQEMNY